MHLSHIGISKLCFLISLALCAFLLLLIPTLQAPQRQGDLPPPPPRPQAKPASARSNKTRVGQSLQLAASQQTRKESAEAKPGSPQGYQAAPAPAAQKRYSGSRSKDPLELKDIFIAIKTTKKYHKSRLELLFQTWVSRAKEQV